MIMCVECTVFYHHMELIKKHNVCIHNKTQYTENRNAGFFVPVKNNIWHYTMHYAARKLDIRHTFLSEFRKASLSVPDLA